MTAPLCETAGDVSVVQYLHNPDTLVDDSYVRWFRRELNNKEVYNKMCISTINEETRAYSNTSLQATDEQQRPPQVHTHASHDGKEITEQRQTLRAGETFMRQTRHRAENKPKPQDKSVIFAVMRWHNLQLLQFVNYFVSSICDLSVPIAVSVLAVTDDAWDFADVRKRPPGPRFR